MQLDQNRIAIRERGFADVLDLALRVVRVYAWPLLWALAAGVVPAMCLNAWLLADYVEFEFEVGFPAAYMWSMLLLVIWETPLATAPLTLYLGQALFTSRPRPGEVARGTLGSLPQIVLYQVIARGLMIPWVITWFFPFVAWPYLNEVILLERNPLWRARPGQVTTYRRTLALHGSNVPDLLLRWVGSMAVGVVLFLSLWLSVSFAGGMLLNQWGWQRVAYTFYFPLALWLVVGYFSVARFLGYLDLRIRREGWEVELVMRAEQARLTREMT